MELRKSTKDDAINIMKIINQAQEYFKINGIDQWQNGYPNIQTVNNDISNNDSYVLLKDNNIIATLALSFDKERTYDVIYDGEWLTNNEYGVIHRIVIDDNYKGTGVASEVMEMVEKLCLNKKIKSIKIDTHEDNVVMQKFLKKNDFKYCGVIYLEDGDKRVAFEKIL